MNGLNQIYASYLVDQTLRRDPDPEGDHVTGAFAMLRSSGATPSLVSRIVGSLRYPSFRRHRGIAVRMLSRAKGTGGIGLSCQEMTRQLFAVIGGVT